MRRESASARQRNAKYTESTPKLFRLFESNAEEIDNAKGNDNNKRGHNNEKRTQRNIVARQSHQRNRQGTKHRRGERGCENDVGMRILIK